MSIMYMSNATTVELTFFLSVHGMLKRQTTGWS